MTVETVIHEGKLRFNVRGQWRGEEAESGPVCSAIALIYFRLFDDRTPLTRGSNKAIVAIRRMEEDRTATIRRAEAYTKSLRMETSDEWN